MQIVFFRFMMFVGGVVWSW